jgi:hypothetical protein
MGGKFRVKVARGGSIGAAANLRRNDRRINQPPHFYDFEKRSGRPKTLFAWQIGCETRQ